MRHWETDERNMHCYYSPHGSFCVSTRWEQWTSTWSFLTCLYGVIKNVRTVNSDCTWMQPTHTKSWNLGENVKSTCSQQDYNDGSGSGYFSCILWDYFCKCFWSQFTAALTPDNNTEGQDVPLCKVNMWSRLIPPCSPLISTLYMYYHLFQMEISY